jgi:uncharacterized protein (TIGR02118 family)
MTSAAGPGVGEQKSMTLVCEIAFAPPIPSAPAGPAAEFIRHLAGLPELLSLDLYTPAGDKTADPYVQDGAAPAHFAMLAFASLEALDRAARQARFSAGLAGMSGSLLTCTAMRRSDHAVGGADAPAPLDAPFSYVVRYHRPAQDETEFVRHYVETHPPLLARLPGIRNVMCYLPLPWRHDGGASAADYMLGNEVVFDDIAAFNAAMASPVRHELRTHFRQFPPFSGRNTHFAMHRRRAPVANLR